MTPFTNTSETHDISNTPFTNTNTNTPNNNNISQTSYIHNMCDIINVPSGSPLQALLCDNAGTIKWPVAVHVRCPSAWLSHRPAIKVWPDRWCATPTWPDRRRATPTSSEGYRKHNVIAAALALCHATPLPQLYTFTHIPPLKNHRPGDLHQTHLKVHLKYI